MTSETSVKPVWTTVKEFEKEGITVRLNQSGRRFSVSVIRKHQDGKIMSFIPVNVVYSLNSPLYLELNVARVVSQLMDEALQHALFLAEEQRTSDVTRLVDRDTSRQDYANDRVRRTGKTERERSKRKVA